MAENIQRLNHRSKAQQIDFHSPLDGCTLKDKGILITGRVSGIGAASAVTFAEAGAFVICLDKNTIAGEAFERAKTAQGLA